jgi:hypothetical protein
MLKIKKIIALSALFFSMCIVCICLAACTSTNATVSTETDFSNGNAANSAVSNVESKPIPDNTTKSTSESSETIGQRNAVRAAKDYLNYTAFSRQGLIKQLEFDKYSDADAEYAVDHIGVDWNEQAAKTAKNYLDYSAFSRQELIKQLEFDGYTSEQAAYGVDKSYK